MIKISIFYKLAFVIILSIIAFILFTGHLYTSSSIVTKTQFFMDTFVKVQTYEKAPDTVFNEVFAKVKDIENKMSLTIADSEVVNINNQSGKSYVKVSDDTYKVIEAGKYYSGISGGKFDITVGPLVKLWNIGTSNARVPSQSEINNKLPLVSYKNILLDKTNRAVMLKQSGMIIDLGGIAKGYTADVISEILLKDGVKHAIINLGGNILAVGGKPDGTPFKIGVQNPFEPRGEYLGIVNITDKTIVTSGIYERYFIQDGIRYHHILDTKTGYPVENSLASVSIITLKSIDADGLSTSVFCMGLKDGMKFVEGLKDVDAIFVTKDYKVYVTSGIKDDFTLTNHSFKLQT